MSDTDPDEGGRGFADGERVAFIAALGWGVRPRVRAGALGVVVAHAPAGDLLEVLFDNGRTELVQSDQLRRV